MTKGTQTEYGKSMDTEPWYGRSDHRHATLRLLPSASGGYAKPGWDRGPGSGFDFRDTVSFLSHAVLPAPPPHLVDEVQWSTAVHLRAPLAGL